MRVQQAVRGHRHGGAQPGGALGRVAQHAHKLRVHQVLNRSMELLADQHAQPQGGRHPHRLWQERLRRQRAAQAGLICDNIQTQRRQPAFGACNKGDEAQHQEVGGRQQRSGLHHRPDGCIRGSCVLAPAARVVGMAEQRVEGVAQVRTLVQALCQRPERRPVAEARVSLLQIQRRVLKSVQQCLLGGLRQPCVAEGDRQADVDCGLAKRVHPGPDADSQLPARAGPPAGHGDGVAVPEPEPVGCAGDCRFELLGGVIPGQAHRRGEPAAKVADVEEAQQGLLIYPRVGIAGRRS